MRSYRHVTLAALPLAVLVGATWLLPAVSGATPRTSATNSVDTTLDSFDGSCSDGDCSLRDAIASTPDGGVVTVPPGLYTLTLTGPGGVGAGDLDLTRSITIRGVGDTGAFIDASGLGQRAFTVAGASVSARLRRLTLFGARDASITGAGVVVTRGSLSLDRVTVTGGRAASGGAIAVESAGTLVVANSLIVGNRARVGGGILVRGAASVRTSSIVGNRAARGGGIALERGALDLATVTASGNRASDVGGGIAGSGSVSMHSVTVAGNRAARGGGIARSSAASRFAVRDSIVADNLASGGGDQCTLRLSSQGHNLEAAQGCGFTRPSDLQGADPRLASLRANGGPTPTRALSAGSAAIGAGARCDPRDQRGVPRGASCDIGAYERALCLGAPVTIVGTDGSDELIGGRADDVVLGLAGNDRIAGSIGNDRICAGRGNDVVKAGRGDDRIAGGTGNDRCDGGPGNDRLSGCEHRAPSQLRRITLRRSFGQ